MFQTTDQHVIYVYKIIQSCLKKYYMYTDVSEHGIHPGNEHFGRVSDD
jgi:hypothetical protein